MKNTIKFAALGACALAASSTAALAGSELPAGISTGIALGAPLPEGVYDISIASYGSDSAGLHGVNLAYAVPVWLIWSTPWQIAGGRIGLTSNYAVADVWTAGGGNPLGNDGFLDPFLSANIKWNLGNGWNFGLEGGAYLPSTGQLVADGLGRDYTAFQGFASLSYVKNGWDLTATGIYGTGGGGKTGTDYIVNIHHHHTHISAAPYADTDYQPEWVNLDLTATRKFGKLELGAIAYGAWDLTSTGQDNITTIDHVNQTVTHTSAAYDTKEYEFAVGSLVGYDFGSFIAQAKFAMDVAHQVGGVDVQKESRGTLTIIKPLWNPQADAPLK
jgi:hypothetical protein